jgi:hypothetical protein
MVTEVLARDEDESAVAELLSQHHREICEQWWWTNDGRIMHPSEMKTDHVVNALALLQSKEPWDEKQRDYQTHWIARFKSELVWRRNGHGTDLRALLVEVVAAVDTGDDVPNIVAWRIAREQADRLRPYVETGACVGLPEADYTEDTIVKRLVGQFLQVVDAEAWYAMQSCINATRTRLGIVKQPCKLKEDNDE